jgi:hypothetical protein
MVFRKVSKRDGFSNPAKEKVWQYPTLFDGRREVLGKIFSWK